MQVTDEIKEEGYYDKGHAIYYFKVTEKQYNELTKNYFEAEQLAKENIKKVSYTYEELFGYLNREKTKPSWRAK